MLDLAVIERETGMFGGRGAQCLLSIRAPLIHVQAHQGMLPGADNVLRSCVPCRSLVRRRRTPQEVEQSFHHQPRPARLSYDFCALPPGMHTLARAAAIKTIVKTTQQSYTPSSHATTLESKKSVWTMPLPLRFLV